MSESIPLRPALRVQFVEIVKRIRSNFEHRVLEGRATEERRVGPFHWKTLADASQISLAPEHH
jgi:hypothetical protein